MSSNNICSNVTKASKFYLYICSTKVFPSYTKKSERRLSLIVLHFPSVHSDSLVPFVAVPFFWKSRPNKTQLLVGIPWFKVLERKKKLFNQRAFLNEWKELNWKAKS